MEETKLNIDPAALKRARLARLWTQEQLSEQSGVSVATISRLERKPDAVRSGTVRRLAEALGVEPETLAQPTLAGVG